MEMTVTAKGQFTLGKRLMAHLGIKPGEKVSVTKTPEGISVSAAKNKLSIDEVLQEIGKIMGPAKIAGASIEEINKAIADGYAEAGMRGLK